MLIAPNIMVMPGWYLDRLLFAQCAHIGCLGGIFYCLRGVYLNKCVQKNWDNEWRVWYFLRPIVSSISGFISCVFLRAGLLALDATPNVTATHYGYLAVAFIAGLNVDNFMKKLESVAETLWGITKSRATQIGQSPKLQDEE